MPGLSGSQKAYKLAIADTARADSTRAGYFPRDVVPVWLDGAARTGMIQESVRIDLNTGDEPHRCSFDFKGGQGFVPAAGHTVVIGHGSTANPLFSGRIIKATRTVQRHAEPRPVYRCEAAGHVFELETARVPNGFYVQSLAPRSIVSAVLALTTPSAASLGFTAAYVSNDLPAVEKFSLAPTESVADAFGRLFRSVDAVWYTDHDRALHGFLTVDSAPGPVPTTITTSSPAIWGVGYTPTDLSRVFTRAQVVGAAQQTLADFVPARHRTVPVASASLIANQNGSTGDDVFVNSSERYLLGGYHINHGFFYRPEAQFNGGQAAIAFPASRGANTITVVSQDFGGLPPIDPDRWYDVGGQWLYVSSTLGLFSTSGGSIAYNYYIHATGAGAIQSDIASFAPLASGWQITVNASSSIAAPIIPAGSPLAVYATRVNTPAQNQVSSLTGSATLGIVSRTFTDSRLSPDGAAAVALSALERGDPSQWAAFDFITRDHNCDIGRPIFVSLTSPAEPSGATIAGAFTAHDVSLGGFGRLTDTRGPERTIRAGAVRRPTFWQVLQGV